jgi:hypothetical protein
MRLKVFALAAIAAFGFAASASASDLDVINNSKVTITELKVAPSSSDNWTSLDDVLKGQAIAPGATGTVTGIDAGDWDLQVTTSDNQICEVLGVSFSGDMKWTVTDDNLAKCED